MTDEEIVCAWMESKPKDNDRSKAIMMTVRWWIVGKSQWIPWPLDLDRLHEVEKKLSEEQWPRYWSILCVSGPKEMDWRKRLVHADAPTRIKALAQVLRESQ